MFLTRYKISTGEITAHHQGVSTDQFPLEDDEGIIDGAIDHDEFYIVNEQAVARPPMTPTINKTSVLADATDLVVITGLPATCIVYVSGRNYNITDGEIELTFDLAGTYLVKIESMPYLDFEVTINAT